MKDRFETELRSALADYAADVPDTILARLREHDYRPRRHPRTLAAGLAGAALVSAAAAGVAAMVGVPGLAGAHPHAPAVAARHPLKLASYSFTLPAHAHVTAKLSAGTSCGTRAAASRPETVTQAGGAFAVVNGGCLRASLGAPVTPANARPVAVGTYHGLIVSDPAARRLTLYVVASAKKDLIFTATRTGLSASQLIAIAVSGLPPCSASMETAPPCLP